MSDEPASTATPAAPKAAPSTPQPETSTAKSTPAATPAEKPATIAPVPVVTTATGTTSSTDAAATQQTSDPDILPASHWLNQPQLNDESDYEDSAYGDDNASSTASLTASILEYRTVHGRTYHSERGNAQSWNPNDSQHEETMDILHHVSTLQQDGKLFLAPIKDNVKRVLDVGCGTGIWAIDFADQFPGAEVIGVDLSPQQPVWIPPNLRFEVDNVTQPWTYQPGSFDYIYMRWLVGTMPDYTALFKEVFTALEPGGYFESKESSAVITSDDGTVADDSALAQWGKCFGEVGKKIGRSFRVIEEGTQRKAMEEAGFVDLQEYDFKTPLGAWPADDKLSEIGSYNQLALERDAEGFVTFLWTRELGWSMPEVQVYSAHLRRELRSGKHHAYYPQKVLIGRKPTDGEVS
ncbi:S-adenosyl-L-methionine-dependent methyltransferase [Hypoxylon sp. NC1633]|nr:S-adenosyl-L-methionine-dependent methyltransferase [Hypoxylon sp. NC1633]